ncbi:hypothetical protein JXA63_01700 [Candidatus Woesebacteria bacterium]|nr:hypothetical protein [Candidatus Woesebacteria bacterium]
MAEKDIYVRFGDEFTSDQLPGNRLVIVDMMNDHNVVGASVVRVDNDNESLGIPGTTSRKYIHEITGRWTLGRIIRAFQNYHGEEVPEVKQLLIEQSEKPPKNLT